MGSYQTTFELPDEWRGRRVLLEFDGIGPAATVWLNTWLGVGVGVGVGLGLGLGLANPNPDPNPNLAGQHALVPPPVESCSAGVSVRLRPLWHRPGPVGGNPADAAAPLEPARAPPSILVCSAWLG